MSSHHIIREGQEPAVFVLDSVPFSAVADLLEWAPVVAVSAEALDVALSWSVKIDAVICSEEEAPLVRERLQHQQPVSVIAAAPQRWIETCLSHLERAGSSAVHVLTNRPEVVFAALEGSNPHECHVTVIENTNRWARLKAIQKWVVAGQKFLIWPENAISHLKTEHLRPISGGFVAENDGIIRLEGAAPFWVGEISVSPASRE